MIFEIQSMPASTRLPDGTLSVAVKCGDEVHSLLIPPEAQQQFWPHLLASRADDPFGAAAVRLKPKGLGRFQVNTDLGLSLMLQPGAAVHVVLAKPLADFLLELLQNWDDPKTWSIPTKQ